MIGLGEIAILGGVIILIFGASRIPKVGRSIGESIKEFKKGLHSEDEKEEDDTSDTPAEKSEKE